MSNNATSQSNLNYFFKGNLGELMQITKSGRHLEGEREHTSDISCPTLRTWMTLEGSAIVNDTVTTKLANFRNYNE